MALEAAGSSPVTRPIFNMVQLSLFGDVPHLSPFQETDLGVELYVKVTPKAAKDRLGDLTQDSRSRTCLKVYVTAAPEDNRANVAVIELVARILKISKSQIEILSGFKCREKTLRISGVATENFRIFKK